MVTATSMARTDVNSHPSLRGPFARASDSSVENTPSSTTELPTRFARNAGSNYLLAVVMALVALVTTPILTGHLGPQKYGIWILVGSTIAYLELLDLGLGGAVVSFVARLSAAGDEDGLDRTMSTSFFVLVALGLGAFVVTVVASQFVP